MRDLEDKQMTLEVRRDVDLEYSRRGIDFMRRSVDAGHPFFLYYNHSLLHLPTIPRLEFKGRSGNGDWADCPLELDHDFDELLDTLEALGVAQDTIVILAGDNGAEEQLLWRGSAGAFDGSYFSSAEGGLRTPCLIRCPGQVPPERSSDEMVHQVDLFPTLLNWTGCAVPTDRVIDGIDQRPFFEGQQAASNREVCLIWLRDRLHGVKWRNFKVMYIKQMRYDEEVHTLESPHVINLHVDPKEREHHDHPHLHTWVPAHTRPLVQAFNASLKREPLIPSGAPLDYAPSAPACRQPRGRGVHVLPWRLHREYPEQAVRAVQALDSARPRLYSPIHRISKNQG